MTKSRFTPLTLVELVDSFNNGESIADLAQREDVDASLVEDAVRLASIVTSRVLEKREGGE